MIGLDTNVLIRYIVRDDEAQAVAATRLIESRCTADEPGFVNLVVLCEVSWVLSRGYKYDRATVAQVIRGILRAAELAVEQSESVWRALVAYEAGGADFADYLIGTQNRSFLAHPTYTFDRSAAKHPDFSLV
jgi:predicted nucleic-acid-binding protein